MSLWQVSSVHWITVQMAACLPHNCSQSHDPSQNSIPLKEWHLKQLILWYEENNLFLITWETETWCRLLQSLLFNLPLQDGYTAYSCVWLRRSPTMSCSLLVAAVCCFAGDTSASGSSFTNNLLTTLLGTVCILLLISRKTCNNTKCLCCVLNFI